MPLQPGLIIINGKYRIIRLIGEGGMGRVWLGEEIAFGNRRVAIKEPRAELPIADRADLLSRYAREVELSALLARAPHVVPALTAEPYEGELLLVMDYLPGGDLGALLRQRVGGMAVDQALAVVADVLVGLDAAHSHPLGIVHRDIKPSNVIFDSVGDAYLADFGVAQVARLSQRSLAGAGPHPGTPLYSAPEQARGTGYLTPAADIYSLGCVLFEMVAGQPYKTLRPGTGIRSMRPELPTWLADLLARALAESPWDHWRDAGEMAMAISTGMKAAALPTRVGYSAKDLHGQPGRKGKVEAAATGGSGMEHAGRRVACALVQ